MNPDAILLAMLAIVDLAVLAHLRQRHALRMRQERIMASMRYAVHRANRIEELPARTQLRQAS